MNVKPEVNKQVVSDLIASAKLKAESYEAKIVNIENALAEVKGELESTSAILEYEAKHEERQKALLDLFVYEGEYGAHPQAHPELIEHFKKRNGQLVARVAQLEHARAQRQKGIALIKEDITLLEKISQHQNRHWISDALLLDI